VLHTRAWSNGITNATPLRWRMNRHTSGIFQKTV